MGQVPLRQRVVEVICDRGASGSPRYRVGSGLLVGGSTVLTAAHVAGAGTLTVCGVDKVDYPARRLLSGEATGVDLALLAVDGPAAMAHLPPVDYAGVDRDAARAEVLEGCWALGYPRFQTVPSGSRQIRETVQVDGVIPVLEGLHTGHLTLRVTAAPRSLPPSTQEHSTSPWSGMSGAVVWCRTRVVGVVTEHYPRRGDSSLTVTPIGWIARLPDAGRWWDTLGTTGDLLPLPAARRAPAPYRSTIAAVVRRTPVLLGLHGQLATVREFATGTQGYLWFTGVPWAGKTALAAHVLRSPPPEVDAVGYILQRHSSDADSARFLAAVIPQLSALLDEEQPERLDAVALHHLWDRAAVRAERLRRHLLLVVDGLDEDTVPSGLPSVAALLPTRVGGCAHVLVTSRPHPRLASDVDVDHPVHRVERHTVPQIVQVRRLQERAVQDLRQLTGGGLGPKVDQLGRAILGVLAAAGGALAADDVAAIADLDPWEVHRLLHGVAGRVVEPLPAPAGARFRFAHPALLDQCRDAVLPAAHLRTCEERVDGWAEKWAETGWPVGGAVPHYLVLEYPHRLVARRDTARLARLVTDPGWVETAVCVAGIEAVRSLLEVSAATVDDPAVGALRRMVERSAWLLRPPRPVHRPGFVAHHLCLAAALADDGAAADPWRRRLAAHPAPYLVPLWTTGRTGTALVRTLGEHDGGVVAVAVAPNGRQVVTGGRDGAVRVWDMADHETPWLLGRHGAAVAAVLVLPDGRSVACGGADGEVWLLDLRGELSARTLGWHEGGVRVTSATVDGRWLLTGSEDGAVLAWDPHGRRTPRPLGQHDGGVAGVVVTVDGQVVTGGYDGTVRIQSLDARAEPHHLGGHDGALSAMAVSPDGRWLVTGGDNGVVRAWDLRGPGGSRLLGRHDESVSCAAVGGGGRLVVTGSRDGTLRVWSLSGVPAGRMLGEHDGHVSAVAVTPHRGLVVSGGGREIRLWDVAAGAAVGEPVLRLNAVALTPDGRYAVATGPGAGLWRWELPSPRPRLVGYPNSVSALAVSPDGRFVVTADHREIRRWDVGSDRPATLVGRHDGWVSALAITPDGSRVVVAGDHPVLVWDLFGCAPPYRWGEERGEAVAVAITGAGTVVVATGDGAVWAGDPDGRHLNAIGRQSGGPACLAPHPDSRQVLIGGADGSVRLWNLDGRPRPRAVGEHPGRVVAAAVTAAGRYALTAGHDGLRLWDLAGGEVRHVAVSGLVAAAAAMVGSEWGSAGASHCITLSASHGLTAWDLRG